MDLRRAAILALCIPVLGATTRQGERPVCDPTDTTFFSNTPLKAREGWYGQHLRAMKEPRLCPDSQTESYRFLWLRTFDAPIAIRITRETSDYRLALKVLSGAGGYAPGSLRQSRERRLTAAEAAELHRQFARARFWTMPTVQPPDTTVGADGTQYIAVGFDGAQWILEVASSGRYHVVDRWSPEHDPRVAAYRELCLFFVRLSGVRVDSAAVY